MATGCEVIWANTGLAIAARKMMARSRGVVNPEPPGPSSPDGVDACVFTAPMDAALAFIFATAVS